jgi:hypothetical protein
MKFLFYVAPFALLVPDFESGTTGKTEAGSGTFVESGPNICCHPLQIRKLVQELFVSLGKSWISNFYFIFDV